MVGKMSYKSINKGIKMSKDIPGILDEGRTRVRTEFFFFQFSEKKPF